MVFWYPNYQDKYIYNIYIVFTEYLKYTASVMYSINKYKLLRHTLFCRQSWEWFQRPSTFCLHPYAIQSGYTANHLSTCWPAGRLVIMCTRFYSRTRDWHELHGPQTQLQRQRSPHVSLTLQFPLLSAGFCSLSPVGEPLLYCLHLF